MTELHRDGLSWSNKTASDAAAMRQNRELRLELALLQTSPFLTRSQNVLCHR